MAMRMRRAAARTLTLGCAVAAAMAGPLPAARAEFTNPDGVAVIIGNRSYAAGVPDVDFAHRDAEAFRRYVLDVLGFDPENLIDLRDTTRVTMWLTFGSRATPKRSLLWASLADGGSDVVVYYSGHGAPGRDDGRGYLLPVDADPNRAELNGYPIDLLYEILARLEEAKTARVFLDAGFSGASGGGEMLIRRASLANVEAKLPAAAEERLLVLTAVSGGQLASWDGEARHGLFTHHLLDALHGKGDWDADGRVTAREAKAYLDRHMTRAATRIWARLQEASFVGDPDAVLARAGDGGAFPPRPSLDGTVPPLETSRAVEQGLGLTRLDRVLVQHGLAALGHEIGAADGIFGPRTRFEIRRLQKAKGFPETGFLTAALLDALKALGEAARDAQRRADDEAAARAMQLGTVAGYEEYLSSHPAGRHVEEIRALLAYASKPK